MKRHLLTICVAVSVLGYFLSEALLRRIVYFVPAQQEVTKTKLINRLPDFLQNYFRTRQNIAKIKTKLEKTRNPAKRVSLLYDLSSLYTSERKQKAIMRQIIEEAPNSPQAVRAWGLVLKEMDAEEVLSTYLDYVERCDIRTPREKVSVWMAGLTALQDESREAQLRYLEKMAKNRVCGPNLHEHYQKLRVAAGAKGDSEMVKLARELETICKKQQQLEAMKRRK